MLIGDNRLEKTRSAQNPIHMSIVTITTRLVEALYWTWCIYKTCLPFQMSEPSLSPRQRDQNKEYV